MRPSAWGHSLGGQEHVVGDASGLESLSGAVPRPRDWSLRPVLGVARQPPGLQGSLFLASVVLT